MLERDEKRSRGFIITAEKTAAENCARMQLEQEQENATLLHRTSSKAGRMIDEASIEAKRFLDAARPRGCPRPAESDAGEARPSPLTKSCI